jgi:molecular chaperone GrpE
VSFVALSTMIAARAFRIFSARRVVAAAARPALFFRSRARFFSSDAPSADASASAGAAAPPGADDDVAAALRTELAAMTRALAEAKEQRAYLAAEMENVRRIARLDVSKSREYGAQPLAKGLLGAVDCLAAAGSGSGSAAADGAALAEGVSATLKLLLKALAEHGVAQFGQTGEKFNPNVHEAVAMLPATDEQTPGTVANVLKTGFMFKDRVLRPAQVTVAVKPDAVKAAAAAAEATSGSSRTI